MTAFLLLAALGAFGQTAPPSPIIVTPAQPAFVVAGPAPPILRIARFVSGPVRCAGAEQQVQMREEPFPAGVAFLPPGGAPAPVLLEFRISAEGQPLGIRRRSRESSPGVDIRDLAPALATWRFARGEERRDCEVAFRIDIQPVANADLDPLYRYVALSRPSLPGYVQAVSRAAFERIRPAGSTCYDPAPTVRQRNYPPFEDIPQAPGTVSHAFISFDIDAAGRPRSLRVASSSGNARLDRESLAAVAGSRYAPQARRGCIYYYFRRGERPVEPPERLPVERFRPEGATCPVEAERRWESLPALTFPHDFGPRAIEGWAVIQFDLAPWGGVGNARVVAAEPAEQFGEQALRIISQARARPSEAGYRGCVERVVFVLPRDNPGFEN